MIAWLKQSQNCIVLIMPRFRKMLQRTLIVQKIILNTLLVRTCTTNRCSRSVNRINPLKSTGVHTRSAQYLIGTLNDFRLSARRSLASAIAAVAVELDMISDTRLISLILIVTLQDKLGKETNQLMEYMRNSCEILTFFQKTRST